MPKAKRVLSNQKCHRCRHDRQKCLPEKRSWPGRRCDRCQHFNYDCSASMTKAQEVAEKNPLRIMDTPDPSTPSSDDFGLVMGYPESEPAGDQNIDDLLHRHSLLKMLFDTCEDLYGMIAKIYDPEEWPTVSRISVFDCLRDVENAIKKKASEYTRQGSYAKAGEIYSRVYCHGDLSKDIKDYDLYMMNYDDDDDVETTVQCLEQFYESRGDFMIIFKLLESVVYSGAHSTGVTASPSHRLRHRYGDFIDRVRKVEATATPLAILTIIRRIAALKTCESWTSLLPDQCRFSGQKRFGNHRLSEEMALAAVLIAVGYKQHEMLLQLLSNECPVNGVPDSAFQIDPLHCAARVGDTKAAEILIERGARIEARSHNMTPLLAACSRNQLDMGRLLLCHGADINAMGGYYERSVLQLLLQSSHETSRVPMLKYLIDSDAPLDSLDYSGRSALYYAARYGCVEDIELLMPCCLSPGKLEDRLSDESLLHGAVASDRPANVRFLLQQGHKTDVTDSKGRTPLHYACGGGKYQRNVEMVEQLLNHGASIDVLDDERNKPMHHAAQYGFYDVVKLLLGRGAGIHGLNLDGRTPFVEAALAGKANICELLAEWAEAHGLSNLR